MNLKKDLTNRLKNSNFNFFELAGFQKQPMLAVKAGMAIGYKMALDDFTSNPVINTDKADILAGRSMKDLSHTITFNDGMDD